MYDNWIPGAALRVWSPRHGVRHFGIAGWVPGTVYHASKDRGQFVLTSFEEFAEGQPAFYERYPQPHQAQTVIARAESVIGHRYDLLASNCEDFVNWIFTGTARSPQREGAIVAALVVLALLIVGFGGLRGAAA